MYPFTNIISATPQTAFVYFSTSTHWSLVTFYALQAVTGQVQISAVCPFVDMRLSLLRRYNWNQILASLSNSETIYSLKIVDCSLNFSLVSGRNSKCRGSAVGTNMTKNEKLSQKGHCGEQKTSRMWWAVRLYRQTEAGCDHVNYT